MAKNPLSIRWKRVCFFLISNLQSLLSIFTTPYFLADVAVENIGFSTAELEDLAHGDLLLAALSCLRASATQTRPTDEANNPQA